MTAEQPDAGHESGDAADSFPEQAAPSNPLPPLASERPLPSRRGVTVGQAMARARALARSAGEEREASDATAKLAAAAGLLADVRAAFETNPSNERLSLAPLVDATRAAIDELAADLDAVHIQLAERARCGSM